MQVKKILLVGNPNVGKSVIFSRLTGVSVIASNYPGTTVEFCRGCVGSGENKIDVVDVPGSILHPRLRKLRLKCLIKPLTKRTALQ
jgi:small GTP-binding protein